jgi:hypothetical protein
MTRLRWQNKALVEALGEARLQLAKAAIEHARERYGLEKDLESARHAMDRLEFNDGVAAEERAELKLEIDALRITLDTVTRERDAARRAAKLTGKTGDPIPWALRPEIANDLESAEPGADTAAAT